MGMPTARVYRNVELRQQLFGIEYPDALVLGSLAALLMLFNKSALGWDLVILLGAYVAVRVFKRGKPEHHTFNLARFYARKPHFSAAAQDTAGAAHPFPFTAAAHRSVGGGRGHSPLERSPS